VNKFKTKISELVDSFSQKRVIVWGDIILDEHLFGNTRRISREAPVLILSYRNKEYSLGGAGNSLLNLQALGAVPVPVGVIGKDAAGDKIIQMLKDRRIPTRHIIRSPFFSTPTKTRILAGEESTQKQQILRIDHEGRVPEDKTLKKKMLDSLLELREGVQALLVSDYNYHTVKTDIFKKVLPRFKKNGLPVTLDSRFRLLEFKGVTILTPNEPEAEAASEVEFLGDENRIKKAGRSLLGLTEAEAVLITRGSRGMILFERSKSPLVTPVQGTTDIVDVTGAGDTVISVLTLALACGGTFQEATELANFAGGVVVMKKGTATLTVEELRASIQSEN
jgi:rfaE bifunctional protein kinase chain/domain